MPTLKSNFIAEDIFSEVSPLTKAMFEGMVRQSTRAQTPVRKSGGPQVIMLDPNNTQIDDEAEKKADEGPPSLTKSIMRVLNGPNKNAIERLAFEADPQLNNTYAAVYKNKLKLIPDHILKRIAIQDDLVAAIVNMRAAQVQSFGRPQPDKYSTGFKIVPDKGVMDKMTSEEKEATEKRIDKVQKILVSCGKTNGWKDKDRLTFAQYLGMSTRNAVIVGRLATEIVYTKNEASGEKEFHSFRPIDAGTIYRAAPYQNAAQAVREEAKKLLEQLKNEEVKFEKFKEEEYAWVQVIEGKPVQAFTEDECVVHNFYPVADVELDGYPVTPIDTAIAAVTTHINITTHNRLYFQSGRAAKGMIIIQSDDANEETVTRIKHQFQASINNVANSWRLPVFAVGKDDSLSWQAIDAAGGRDMEFQYLNDTNARVIMSAFQVSPEELPGYQHLSRGTNNQALSESNNEYKLEAARDVGIRPLIAQFEDFLNARILPLLDGTLAEFCTIKFCGLDAETPEKQNVRVKEAMDTHMTYDDVLGEFEKKPVGLKMGGQLPLNALYGQKLDAYFTVGQILEFFCGIEGASNDPMLQYRRDPFYFQNVQLMMQQQQMQQQAQAQAQGQPPPGGDGGGGDGQAGQQPGGADQPPGDGGQQQAPPQQGQGQQGGDQQTPDLSTGLDQVIGALSKSEAQLPPSRRRLLEQQRRIVARQTAHMEKDLAALTGSLFDIVKGKLPKG